MIEVINEMVLIGGEGGGGGWLKKLKKLKKKNLSAAVWPSPPTSISSQSGKKIFYQIELSAANLYPVVIVPPRI